MTVTTRRLLAAALFAAAAFGATAPASADPTCKSQSVPKVATVGACTPGMVCGTDTPCNWHNPDVTCTTSTAAVVPACNAIDDL